METSETLIIDPASIGARRWGAAFTRQEWWRLSGLYGFVALLHILGWGAFLFYAARYPALVGLGFIAYMFGLRHAFDADHIAAVNDTVHFMCRRKSPRWASAFSSRSATRPSYSCWQWSSTFAAVAVKHDLPGLQNMGGVIGASVSGIFLWLIGILNLLVSLDILKVWKTAKAGTHSHKHLDQLLSQRGLFNRLFGGRLQRTMQHSWQMYPLGLLFGLGFDTASEIGLLAMTAGASAGNLPWPAVLSLPVLFAAGMSIMDTTDGVLMTQAYHWAFLNPLRNIFGYPDCSVGWQLLGTLICPTLNVGSGSKC